MDAHELFMRQGLNCAEATLAGLTKTRKYSSLASGFGGGIGGTHGTCGAVTGAVMGMGCRLRVREEDPHLPYSEFSQQIRTFLERFEADHGSIWCRHLLALDAFPDAESAIKYFKSPGRKERCGTFVAGATEIAEALLKEVTD